MCLYSRKTVGKCVGGVRRTDRLELITAAYASAAFARWTTTAPGMVLSNVLNFGPENVSISNELTSCRINNCVGEANHKFFLQFLFYTGKIN